MKSFLGGAIPASLAALLALASCQSLSEGRKGSLSLRIACEEFTTKASIPDTDDFILKVSDSKGNVIYSGQFGASPEDLVVSAGTYTIQAWSCEFSTPLFDTPQYGDTEVVVVKEGEQKDVTLYCSQVNAGIRLTVHPDFLTDYPAGVLFLKSAEGKLMYSYSEKRIAYFLPGSVSLVLSNDGVETTLFTRKLAERQILTVNLTVAGSGSSSSSGTKGGVSIQIDTARNYLTESFTIGSADSEQGSDLENALSVSQAREAAGQQDVWVYGYIVGGDLSSSRCSFEPPFSSKTNLVIASRSSCTDKESCLSVQLQKGDVRDDLNLVDHEDLLGRKVWLKGDIVEAYYGIPGLQCVTEYVLKD